MEIAWREIIFNKLNSGVVDWAGGRGAEYAAEGAYSILPAMSIGVMKGWWHVDLPGMDEGVCVGTISSIDGLDVVDVHDVVAMTYATRWLNAEHCRSWASSNRLYRFLEETLGDFMSQASCLCASSWRCLPNVFQIVFLSEKQSLKSWDECRSRHTLVYHISGASRMATCTYS